MLLKIKEIRTNKKISQDELSKKTGLSKRMIIDYEKENTDIQIKKLQLIASALEVDFFEMFNVEKNYINTDEANKGFATLNEPKEIYESNIELLKDYNLHLKKQVHDLNNDKELLQLIIKSRLVNQ